jgi:hypothetical protein
MARFLMTAHTNALPGRDKECNEWYETYHVRELLQVPGIVGAQRYGLAPVRPPADWPYQPMPYSYLALYDIETDNLQEFANRLWDPATTSQIRKSDAFDYSRVTCQLLMPLGPKREK